MRPNRSGFEAVQSFQDSLLSYGLAGSDLAVYRDGSAVYRRLSGLADVAARVPITKGTIFRMYSMTKPITCTAMLKLVEDGRARLDDPLDAYLPEYRHMWVQDGEGLRPAKNSIRLVDLLSMTAGFDYNLHSPALLRLARETPAYALRAFARALSEEPLGFEPGTRWRYSLCHDVLAAVIEVVSGMRFGEYLRRALFEPLGMKDTCFFLSEEQRSRLARTYALVPGQRPSEPLPETTAFQLSPAYESGGAGISATVNDYALFANALCLHRGLLRPDTLRLMRTNRLAGQALKDFRAFKPHAQGYGLGVYTSLAPDGRGPFGWGGAAGTYLVMDPKERLTVLFACQALPSGAEYVRPRLLRELWAALCAKVPGFHAPVPYYT